MGEEQPAGKDWWKQDFIKKLEQEILRDLLAEPAFFKRAS
jgi:hypothetical protein